MALARNSRESFTHQALLGHAMTTPDVSRREKLQALAQALSADPQKWLTDAERVITHLPHLETLNVPALALPALETRQRVASAHGGL